jgi:hypothetical protein
LAGDIAIQYIGGGRYCNQYIDWLHILQYNILVVADIAINILMTEDIAIQYIARHRYCNKYIGRSQKHQYNNNIIVRIPGHDSDVFISHRFPVHQITIRSDRRTSVDPSTSCPSTLGSTTAATAPKSVCTERTILHDVIVPSRNCYTII